MTHLSLFMLGFTVVLIANFISLTKAERRLVPTVLFKEVTDIRNKWLSGEYEDKDHHYEVLLEALAWYKNEYDRQRRRLGEINRANLVASFAESQEQDIVNAEIGTDASFKPRRLAATEQSIFEELSSQEFEQWIDIMSRIKWTSLNAGDRRRLESDRATGSIRPEREGGGGGSHNVLWVDKTEESLVKELKGKWIEVKRVQGTGTFFSTFKAVVNEAYLFDVSDVVGHPREDAILKVQQADRSLVLHPAVPLYQYDCIWENGGWTIKNDEKRQLRKGFVTIWKLDEYLSPQEIKIKDGGK